jgi:hypothetical protein
MKGEKKSNIKNSCNISESTNKNSWNGIEKNKKTEKN